ncbi:nucleotidyltransferase family protein [Actinotalea fermentans]|uniref:nucleotidyltransferase family protein n=1 Tax=Actinotalea fermentans TaxID=43671 RepID=UPI00068AABCA|nr:nucleotidyltransferase domain-containing protein [Actinotalea fermentans]
MPCSDGLQGQVDGGVPRLAKLRANRARIHTIASGHGASNVRFFGSVARGDDGPGSDVDLLVDLDVHTRGLLPLAAMSDELSVLLDERVDVVASGALAREVLTSALSEAVPL